MGGPPPAACLFIVGVSLGALACGGSPASSPVGPSAASPPSTSASAPCPNPLASAPVNLQLAVGPAITEPDAFGLVTTTWPEQISISPYQCAANPVRYGAHVSEPVVPVIAKSPSRIVLPLIPLILAQADVSDVNGADCAVMTEMEYDLRVMAVVPRDVRDAMNGDWYRIQMVDAHEDLHVRHHTEEIPRVYARFTAELALLSADSPQHVASQAQALTLRYFNRVRSSEWQQWAAQEGAHPNPNQFTTAELGAAQEIFDAITARRAALRCATPTPLTYRYRGNRFNSFSCGAQACATPMPGQSSYTPNNFVEITLTVPERLRPNLRLAPVCFAVQRTPCRYTLVASDGVQPPKGAANNPQTPITISTDAQGNIVAPWQINIGEPTSSRISTLIFEVGSDLDGGWRSNTDFGRVVGQRGVWTIDP